MNRNEFKSKNVIAIIVLKHVLQLKLCVILLLLHCLSVMKIFFVGLVHTFLTILERNTLEKLTLIYGVNAVRMQSNLLHLYMSQRQT